LIASGWASRASPAFIPAGLLEWGLGAGETAVLALTLEHMPATAIVDDASARAAARALGLPVIGTLGVVIRAKLRGLVPSAANIIADLRVAGLFLDERNVRDALKQIGE
jgi:predicted nucleic acid-binding protein